MRQNRKTNDAEILALKEKGLNCKQISEWYLREKNIKVSSVAVWKRLKKLAPYVILEKYNLPEDRKGFVIEKARGLSNVDAVLRSHKEVSTRDSAKSIGCQLMKDPDVNAAIQDIMAQEGAPRRARVQVLGGHIFSKDPEVSLRALDQSWKLSGDYAPEKSLNMNLDISITAEEANDLLEISREIARKKTIDLHKEDGNISNNGDEN